MDRAKLIKYRVMAERPIPPVTFYDGNTYELDVDRIFDYIQSFRPTQLQELLTAKLIKRYWMDDSLPPIEMLMALSALLMHPELFFKDENLRLARKVERADEN